MKSKIAFAMLFLILLSACASGSRFIQKPGFEKLSPRPAPAKATTESDEYLKKNGYLTIGWITKETVFKTCWNPDCEAFSCPAADSNPTDFTDEFTRQAAKHGGDLVFMSPGKEIKKVPASKKGKCTSSHVVYNVRKVYIPGEYRDGNLRTATVAEEVCDSWESIDGYQCASISGGTVWRHDPELVKNLVETEKEKNRAESEQKRLTTEAIRNKERFAALNKAYEANTREKREEKDLVFYKVIGILGDKYGYKDRAGNIVIKAQFTNCLGNFHEGLAAVSIKVKGKNAWGFIDKTGKWVISPVYEQVSVFSEGLAPVEEEGRKAGFIDKKGNFVIEPVFDHAFEFRDGKAKVWIYFNMGIYDRATGKLYLEK